jgi:hypothetical protein
MFDRIGIEPSVCHGQGIRNFHNVPFNLAGSE